ncbi:VOC family protein [Streptomyces sp. NPDC096311]|uniref:VOC family protein n=1 Tax=Streptomyces sp. NPDC096311 TaxID=3366083 RepID=UPI00383070CF
MFKLPPLLHIGQVVHDARAAVKDLQDRYGLEEIRPAIELTLNNQVDGSEHGVFNARYHFLGLGNTELEIIEPVGSAPSPYTQFLEEFGEGLHHLAFNVDSIEEHLAAAPSAKLLVDAPMPYDSRMVYAQGLVPGALMELIEVPGDFAEAVARYSQDG